MSGRGLGWGALADDRLSLTPTRLLDPPSEFSRVRNLTPACYLLFGYVFSFCVWSRSKEISGRLSAGTFFCHTEITRCHKSF